MILVKKYKNKIGWINKNGKFIIVNHGEHDNVKATIADCPRIRVCTNGQAFFEGNCKLTQHQLDTLFDWCHANGKFFDEVTATIPPTALEV